MKSLIRRAERIAFVRANLRPSSNRAPDRRFAAGGRFAQLDSLWPQSSHNFSGGSGDGSDDPSDPGKPEDGDDVVGIWILPEASKPKPCPQPSSERRQADNPCNHRHDHTSLVRDQSTGNRPLDAPDPIISHFALQSQFQGGLKNGHHPRAPGVERAMEIP
jgi:hypothetical protein